MKRQELVLVLILLAASAAVFLGYRLFHRGTGRWAVVYVGKEERGRFSLEEDGEFLLTGKGGGTNRLVIRKGEADVTEASCPDKICVHQNPISQIGETIVCMPNQVIVTIEGENQN